MSKCLTLCRRFVKTAARLARDHRLPRWLRVILVLSCLPIPGPVDNLLQVAVCCYCLTRYRAIVLEHWAAV